MGNGARSDMSVEAEVGSSDRETATSESDKPVWRRKRVIIPVLVVGAAVLAVAMYLFQPWALFTNVEVDEAIPAGPAAASASTGPSGAPASSGPETLASGTFISLDHPTAGDVKIIETANGDRFVRFENFETDNGPDVKVWITNTSAKDAAAARDGSWVNLGDMKGNIGSQNYKLPADLNLDDYTSVVLWCDRFSVPFGAAEI